MRLAGTRRAEEHDVLASGDEVEGPEVQQRVSVQGSLEREVEVLDSFTCWEPGRFDVQLPAVGSAGRDGSGCPFGSDH